MKLHNFVITVVVAAALVVGAVYVADRTRLVTVEPRTEGPPIFAFLPNDSPQTPGRIECPIAEVENDVVAFSGPIPLCWLEDGWSSAQKWGRWVKRPVASFEIHLDRPARQALILQARAAPGLPPGPHQTLTLTVNDHPVATRKLQQKWGSFRIEIPKRVFQTGRNRFSLAFSDFVPGSATEGAEVRISKSAGISEITVVRLNNKVPDSPSPDPHNEVWDADRQSLILSRAGTLVLPTAVPIGAKTLEFNIRAEVAEDQRDTRIRCTLEDFNGDHTRETEIEIPVKRSLTLVELPVDDLADRWIMMTVYSDSDLNRIEVSNLRFSGAGIGSQRRAHRSKPPRRPPDIVWITLDAARVDHFGLAGYHRDTSPFVDSIAAESLVFPHAYSLAPYTLCSVPTMISGLSFLDHGVVSHEDVLSPEVVTLAEILRDTGYLTAAFSATPNNSKAKGFDQGYEVFREMWTEGELKDTRRAPFIARKVVEWLEATKDDGRPLHLQVHIVPPHAPYDPPPAFDRYTDPGYDGPCDGWPRTVFNLNNGIVEADIRCLEHLNGLYDGNINVADDAVRTIVEALRRRPGWDNTVLLVTSDHGEAFMEHEQMGHNTTLFSEMMHVPFVLRLPETLTPSGIDTDGLVTLADIVPTLLHAAGVTPPPLTDGLDLLDSEANRAGRLFFGRTASETPVLGVRTLGWSLMINSSGSGALYDTTTDPSERINLSVEHSRIYTALGKILVNRIAAPPRLNAAQTDSISAEERELLETLGYLQN